MRRVLIFTWAVALLATLVVLMPGQVSANGVACPVTITQDTTLKSDLSCSGTAIVIAADNVVLDGGGHILDGNGTGSGVDVQGRSGVVVQNLTIRGFSIGVSLYQVTISTVEKNQLLGDNRGIRSWDSSQNVIERNIFDGNFLALRLLASSDENYVAKNVIVNTTGNALDVVGDMNVLFQNELRSNTWGITLSGATGNTVEKNVIDGTIGDGFRLASSSTGNVVSKNLVKRSGWNGYSADGTSIDNNFDRNESIRNTRYGFIDGSLGTGTAGTANAYTKNSCLHNSYGGSSPVGLCN